MQHGVDSQITVQRICRDCGNEEEVKEVLDAIWESPDNANSILNRVAMKNKNIFELEHKLAVPIIPPESQNPRCLTAANPP